MSLEFDYECAILQSALNTVVRKFARISSLEFSRLRSAVEIVNRAYDDILNIRGDEYLSILQKRHRDRKLVFGLMCSVYREKVEFWYPNESFESFGHIYPTTGWPFILEMIKSFDWNDFFIEFLDSTHPETLKILLNDVLSHLLEPIDQNLSILLQILTLLVNKMISFCQNSSSIKKTIDFEAQIDATSSCLALRFANNYPMDTKILHEYRIRLFEAVFDSFDALLNIPDKNLENHLNDEFSIVDSNNFEWLIKFYRLCFDGLLSLGFDEMAPLAYKLKEKKGSLADLKLYLNVLNSNFNCDREIVSLLQSIHQRMELLLGGIWHVESKISSNFVDIIDLRNRHYEERLDELISTGSLLKRIDHLECLERNSSLINEERAHSLMKFLENQVEKGHFSNENIQKIVLLAFSQWPSPIRRRFLRDCLIRYEEKGILMSDKFEEELTTTFNKFVCVDTSSLDNLSIQMGLLCLRSTRKTIAQTIFQAMNSSSKSQIDALSLLLKRVLYNSNDISIESQITCQVINEILIDYCLTELQFQNLKMFICNLLNYNLQLNSLIESSHFVRICILPHLTEWNLGLGSRITLFSIQLLGIILDQNDEKQCEFNPCVLSCYLALIIGQCKTMKHNSIDWVQMKSESVATLIKLIKLIESNLDLIQKKQVFWLYNKLNKIDEYLSFYFIRLFHYFDMEIIISNNNDPFRLLFEFTSCNDDNTTTSIPFFKTLIQNSGIETEQRIINSLSKVLPYFILDEWKRITIVLESILDHFSTNWKPFATISKYGLNLCRLSSIYLRSISMHLKDANAHFMVQCYRSIVKAKLDLFDHPESSVIAAELFVQVNHSMRFSRCQVTEEIYILLMELSQIYVKDSDLKYLNKMQFLVKNIQIDSYRSSLLKVLFK